MVDPEAIQKAIAGLDQEDEQISDLIRKLTTQQERIRAARVALVAVVTGADEPAEFEGKLADACRAVLKKATNPLTPVEVRDELKVLGYDIAKHKNIMASVHSVLKRLAESDSKEVASKDTKEGARYWWVGERPKSLLADYLTTYAPPPLPLAVSAGVDPLQFAAPSYQTLIDQIAGTAAMMTPDRVAEIAANLMASVGPTVTDQVQANIKAMVDAVAGADATMDIVARAGKMPKF